MGGISQPPPGRPQRDSIARFRRARDTRRSAVCVCYRILVTGGMVSRVVNRSWVSSSPVAQALNALM
jgi:hypothetical protein